MTNEQARYLGGCVLTAGGAVAYAVGDAAGRGGTDGGNVGIAVLLVGGFTLLITFMTALSRAFSEKTDWSRPAEKPGRNRNEPGKE